MIKDDPHTYTVYRCYDAADQLIYIGCAFTAKARFAQHRQRTEWWSEVDRIEQEPVTGRRAALTHERALIEQHEPKHNRMYTARCDLTPNAARARAIGAAKKAAWDAAVRARVAEQAAS